MPSFFSIEKEGQEFVLVTETSHRGQTILSLFFYGRL
jgi:hypothetical protein